MSDKELDNILGGDVRAEDEVLLPGCAVETEEADDWIKIYEKPYTLTETRFHYCPGCGHSTVHKILAEVIQEMGIQDEVIGVAPVDVQYLHMTTLILICRKQHTEEPVRQQRELREYCRRNMYSHTRETGT